LTPLGQIPGGGEHRVLVLDSRTIVLGWEEGEPEDLPAAVFALLRLAAAAATRGGDEVDLAQLATKIDELAGGLRPLDIIQTQTSAATKALAKISESATELRVGLEMRIAAVQAALHQ
jgi:hypothetical protein